MENSSVPLRAGSEADSQTGEVYSLMKEETPPTEQSGASSGQSSTDELDSGHLLQDLRDRVREMLTPLAEIWGGRLGVITGTMHRITSTEGSKPFRSQPYRAGPLPKRVEQEAVNKMLTSGAIAPSQSQWVSPAVLVSKTDGSLRVCVNYRKLNVMKVRETYPIFRMDECLVSFEDATVFTTLDCNKGIGKYFSHRKMYRGPHLRVMTELLPSVGCLSG